MSGCATASNPRSTRDSRNAPGPTFFAVHKARNEIAIVGAMRNDGWTTISLLRPNVHVTGAQGPERPKGADALGRPSRLAG
jgi:hypothetical protein